MKKILSLIFVSFLIFSLSSCKKPQKEKTAIQQTIETPVMQMAEPPQMAKSIAPTPETAQEIQPTSQRPQTTPPSALAPTAPASTTLVKSATNLEIIIDASGSMNTPIGTTTKIDAIKNALKDIFSAPLPSEAANRKIAVRTFGGKSPADKNDCTDTALEFPMGKYDQAVFETALERIVPQGTAPIAFALEEANKDFAVPSENVDNLIILITDGLDLCNGNIPAAVERLNKSAGRVIVDIIGFDVDQTAQETLKNIAKTGSGQFFLARSDAEVATSLDQIISANLPYNLRVKVISGASPVPSLITIYRANTQSVVDRSDSPGFKFFKLAPGTYDIQVEYKDSIESAKPSKIIKGVEVTNTTKAEQVVQFELGNLNLTALDQNGNDTTANIYIRKAGSEEIAGKLTTVQSPQMIHLTPGTYDIDAETAVEETPTLTTQIKDIEIKTGETTEQTIKFQTGKLFLKAQNVAKEAVPITYKITKPDSSEEILTGTGLPEGVIIDLPPGKYDIYVIWSDPKIQGSAETKLSNIAISGGETLEQLATIITGSLKLSGKNSAGKFVHTEYSIKKPDKDEEVAKAVSEEVPVDVFLAPGSYNVVATDTTSKVVPQPSVAWENITIKEGQTETLEVVFRLGTLKLIGKNAKQQTIPTIFTIYRGGTDEPIVVERSERDFVTFNLTPSLYDVKAEDAMAKSDPKPSVWFHDVEIKEGATISSEAIFTSGKLKLICRGKNNTILTCEFNVFTYGSDTALFSGATAEEWKEFDIPPGKYYMEAGWHDPKDEQFLKKWINVSIGENQIVEQVLRF